jgi:hypothetical protein
MELDPQIGSIARGCSDIRPRTASDRRRRGVRRCSTTNAGSSVGQDRHQRRPTRPVETPRRLGQLDEPAVARARAGDQHLIHIIAQTYTPVRED